jgi:hypothetical protein
MRAPMNGGGQPEFLFDASNIMGLRCSRNGPCVLAERRDETMVVSEVDPVKGVKTREIYHDRAAASAAPDLSPDGKWLATLAGTKIVFRSFATGRVDREISLRGATDFGDLVSLDYAPDGKGFFAGQNAPTETRQLYIDLSGKTTVLWRQAGSFMVWGIPSPDGRHLAMMMHTDDSNVYTVQGF